MGGTIFWQELHSSVTTNSFGLINIVIGKGTKIAGVATFSAIDWSVTPKYIMTEINYGGWKNMGSSKLWSVPYALIASDFDGPVKKLAVTGETASLDEALFEVKNKDGNTVFAVYNEGVRVYVADGAKGLKGGFSVGGFGTDKPGESQKYLVVSKDSVRIYLDTNPLTKKLKGGFAVGGYDMTKAPTIEDYLQVTRDSTRIYVNEGSGKSVKGGFAVGGFDITKGTQTITPFTSLTPENYLIGHEAGKSITTGLYNSFIGYKSGRNTSTGNSNTFMGYQSGLNNKTGIANLYIGYQAGYAATTGNGSQFIGYSNTTGTVNTFVGTYSGMLNTKGSWNTYVENMAGGTDSLGRYNAYYGYETGSMSQGSWDTYIGSKSGNENLNGNYNSFLGNYSGEKSTGSKNVFIGYNSGNLSDATGNVFLGYYSGHNFDRSNSLIISNSDAAPYDVNALIYGEFDNKMLRINGLLQLPYNSGNSVLTMKMGNGNSMFIKPEGDLIRLQSDHTGNPTIFWFDKTGLFGIGSSLSVGGGLTLGGTLSVSGGLYAAINSGMVGIGTSTPSYLLHVYKSPASTAWLSTFQNGSTSVQLA